MAQTGVGRAPLGMETQVWRRSSHSIYPLPISFSLSPLSLSLTGQGAVREKESLRQGQITRSLCLLSPLPTPDTAAAASLARQCLLVYSPRA